MNILIIGGTGFIGQRLVRSLYAQGHHIFLLTRMQSLAKASIMFKDLPLLQFVPGNIENTDVLANITDMGDQIDCVVHLAAVYKLDVSMSEAYQMNVLGTQNVLKLLQKMKNVKHFHYFSTYAVNQISKGNITEDYLAPEGSPFFDHYSKTKNHAEHLVRVRTPEHMKVVIHRPGIIIGDSRDGSMDKEDGPYYFFKFILSLKKFSPILKKLTYLPLPVQKNSLLPVLPVDILVNWSTEIILHPPTPRLSCYHLVPIQPIMAKDFLEFSMELMDLPLKIVSVSQAQIFPAIFKAIKMPKELVFYMRQEAYLDRSNLLRDYPHLAGPTMRDFLPKIIQGYMRKQNERDH